MSQWAHEIKGYLPLYSAHTSFIREVVIPLLSFDVERDFATIGIGKKGGY
jgi:hypothetical protein